eukprot:1151369-Pelagomonas_calceolata.AAC.2
MLLCNRCGIHYMRYKKLPGPKREQLLHLNGTHGIRGAYLVGSSHRGADLSALSEQINSSSVSRFSAPSSPMHCGKRKASDAWADQMGSHTASQQGQGPAHFSVGSYPGPSSAVPPEQQHPHPHARSRSLSRQVRASAACASLRCLCSPPFCVQASAVCASFRRVCEPLPLVLASAVCEPLPCVNQEWVG